MFLPALLVRDYGIWGFVVFAVPNVIGAAAMGWVLTRDASIRATSTHAAACRVFSIVTIAFQLFFLGGLLTAVVGWPLTRPWWAVVMLAGAAIWGLIVAWWPRSGSAVTLLASSMLLMLGLRAQGWDVHLPDTPVDPRLVWMAPVCVFGFLLCPYLDLTFHRARQQTSDADARGAFTLGFGGLFLSMILGTLTYASIARGVIDHHVIVAGTLVAGLIGSHIAMQLGATVALHATEMSRPRADAGVVRHRVFMALTIAVLVAAIALVTVVILPSAYRGLSRFELVYRLFMTFYGLIFPAYVWLCMIPARGEPQTRGPTTQKLSVLAIACLLAAPCYWMGFIERETVWLAPGLGAVLLSRFFIKGSK